MSLTRDANWWHRLDAAFQGALDLPSSERAAYLDRACGADAVLRAEVDAMLTADASDAAFRLERLVRDADADAADDAVALDPDPLIGARLGAWRVIDVLGQGGMGTVYLAERADGQYEQQVALKLIRGPDQHAHASTRFTAETYILARLSHPHIARLFDAGFTPDGAPYFVMEHVDGCAVTTYCDEQRLTVDARLRLFRVVCDATQHAHQSLVVHRDLTPSNILVSRAGEVKLLDFGIAKLLESDHPLADHTTTEMRALTPAYAAPEQLRGEPVTTAADVYVLGVVLYELLTGHRPVRDVTQTTAGIPAPSVAVRRRLTTTETSDTSERNAMADAAAARGTTPSRLARRLDGDLDRVMLKALAYEPERRYGSAGQLAEDIARLLDGRPVSAQPDTLSYRTRRFIGRHRVGMSMAAVLCALIVAFAVVAAIQGRTVAIERDRARVEADRAARVSVLVTDLFKLAEPAVGRGDTITARELLDQGARRVALELRGDPETQAALFNALARVYGNLGLHDTAIDVLQRALDLERGAHADGSLAEAATLHLLGERHVSQNDYVTGEQRLRAALALRRRLHAPDAEVAATLHALGQAFSLTGKFAEAGALMEDAVAIWRRQPRPHGEALMSALYELGVLVHRSGDMVRSERLFREAVDVGRGIDGASPAKVASLVQLAGVVADFDRDRAKAEPLFREALSMARAIYPEDHQEIASCLNELARNLLGLGRLAEAEATAREAVGMLQRLYGEPHDDTLFAKRTLATVMRAARRLDEAERLFREALADSRALFGDANPTTLATSRALATVLEERGRFEDAGDLRRTELARTITLLGEHDVFVAIGLHGLGRHGLASGRLDHAETYFTRALAVRQHIHPANHWRIDEARGWLGEARLRAGRFAEAEPDLLAAYEGLRTHRGPSAEETQAARARLVDLYERTHRLDRAKLYR